MHDEQNRMRNKAIARNKIYTLRPLLPTSVPPPLSSVPALPSSSLSLPLPISIRIGVHQAHHDSSNQILMIFTLVNDLKSQTEGDRESLKFCNPYVPKKLSHRQTGVVLSEGFIEQVISFIRGPLKGISTFVISSFV